MDKWEKVVTLHRILAGQKHCIPLSMLLDRMECSAATFHRIRTFMRDSLGAPIEFDKAYSGYRYDCTANTSFELPGMWFTMSEVEALLQLDAAVESLQAGFFGDVFAPIKKRFEPLLKAQKTSVKKFGERVRILSMGSRACDSQIFRTVATAVLCRHRLVIGHRALTDINPVLRTISPQTLIRYRDNWYVDAHCHLRNDLRTFALDRILSAARISGKFHHVDQKKLDTFFADSYGIFTGNATHSAVIEFTGTAAAEVSRQIWHPRQSGHWIDTATFRLTIPYGHSHELIMDVLRWGDAAEVVSPPTLRTAIKTIIDKAQKKYKK